MCGQSKKEKAMIELTIFPPALNLRSPSPFSLKTELLLKMTKLDYKIKLGSNPAKAPNGKFPVMNDNGKIIADSHFIYQHICETYNVDLDSGLSDAQKAISAAFTRLAEDHLYWVMIYSRWVDEDFDGVVDVFFKAIPWGIRQLVTKAAKKQAVKNIHAHGISRHDKSKIYQLGKEDIDAIATQLGDNRFFHGDAPSSVDAIIYSIVASNYYPDVNSPLKQYVLGHKNLVSYLGRIETEFNFKQNI